MEEPQETWVQCWSWEDSLEEETATHSSILAGEFRRQRSLTGYSPRDRKESDMTEVTSHGMQGTCKCLLRLSVAKYYVADRIVFNISLLS